MWSLNAHVRRRLAVLAAAMVLSMLAGCGVKSKPAFPEGSTYPQDYPARTGTDVKAGTTAPASSPRPAARTAPDGTYSPPPAATDPNFR